MWACCNNGEGIINNNKHLHRFLAHCSLQLLYPSSTLSLYHRYQARNNPLGVVALEGFATVLANAGVCQGKWQYEVNIASGAVMQVGWTSSKEMFSSERGVGDTIHSYAYDSNRAKAWNEYCRPYGEVCQAGDIITCAIDMDDRTISYARNGKDFDVAFSKIVTGPGVTYFPAFSISKNEYISVNFGEMPLHHPRTGYNAIQQPPELEEYVAKRYLTWIHRAMDIWPQGPKPRDIKAEIESPYLNERKSDLIIFVDHVITLLKPILLSDINPGIYVVQSALIPFMQSMIPHNFMCSSDGTSLDTFPEDSAPEIQRLHLFLSLLHSTLSPTDMIRLMQRLMIQPYVLCRQPALDLHFNTHKMYIKFIGALLTHSRTRDLFISKILFSANRLENILCFSMDEALRTVMIPDVYWSKDDSTKYGDYDAYEAALDRLDTAMQDVERLHEALIMLLMTVEERPYVQSSRFQFLSLLKKTIISSRLNKAKVSYPRYLCHYNKGYFTPN